MNKLMNLDSSPSGETIPLIHTPSAGLIDRFLSESFIGHYQQALSDDRYVYPPNKPPVSGGGMPGRQEPIQRSTRGIR